MIATLTIAIWSHLFCGKWSEPGGVFGWLKAFLYKRLPAWAFQPAIGCAMCHAVWASLAWEGFNLWRSGEVGIGSILSVLCSSYMAELLNDFQEWREKAKA